LNQATFGSTIDRGTREAMPLRYKRAVQSTLKPVLEKAKPFVKWAGGKQQLLAQYEAFLPGRSKRYFEPFVGGGAVFFHSWNTGRLPEKGFLFDNNEELVNAYRVVRDQVDELLAILAAHKARHCQEYFYEIRSLDRQDVALSDVERAARTIYLNKTCYNGLYRVNRKGQFNVPMGSYKNPRIQDECTLKAANAALQGVCIEIRDFRTIVDLAHAGDFFYFDPPYDPLSRTARFTSYTAGSFGHGDQRDLANVFARLSEAGCRCMLSNSYTPFVLELYKQFTITAPSVRILTAGGASKKWWCSTMIPERDPCALLGIASSISMLRKNQRGYPAKNQHGEAVTCVRGINRNLA
jgi:DNA adenine methylase